ncbi:hypothetical protein [Microcystis sp. M061S2]|uniref:hypothetical protein n=1 Tax=Microcystis sp. M061S2 TaxID=2771171 RepID=UPI002584EB45|nr:hypothetical protein [Microcystis sp. M061S2]MCA2656880.1 hypothetical protein [Microcystis sp. M061S2]
MIQEFDLEHWLVAADQLMKADEAERALQLLDLIPGYYRDNTPEPILAMRRDIEAAIFQVHDYKNVDGDLPKDNESVLYWIQNVTRGRTMLEDVKAANAQGIVPHLVDMGPGDYMLPLGLKLHGCKFTYEPIGLEPRAYEMAQPRLGEALGPKIEGAQTWFIAYEIIEHIWNPRDLAAMAWRQGNPDRVYLSTPRYCFGEGCKQWRTKKQPHLRTYTPQEFWMAGKTYFPGYNFEYIDDPVMVLKGIKK